MSKYYCIALSTDKFFNFTMHHLGQVVSIFPNTSASILEDHEMSIHCTTCVLLFLLYNSISAWKTSPLINHSLLLSFFYLHNFPVLVNIFKWKDLNYDTPFFIKCLMHPVKFEYIPTEY